MTTTLTAPDSIAPVASILEHQKQTPKQQGLLPSRDEFLAGWAGGMAQVLVGQPFDTIKVRLQTASSLYTSPLDCLLKSIRREGPQALYKVSPPRYLVA